MTEIGKNLSNSLQPIADQFKSMNIPAPITHWGHPFFMAIVIFAMGSLVAISGWRSRISTDTEVISKSKAEHRKVAPLMTVFLATGYTGGLLSLVMQGKPLLESPHFITGSVVLTLLTINGTISLTGFAGNQPLLRKTHAYLGSAIALLLVAHAILGLKLGLSI
jgi:phosphatidylglycerophosphate synthase